MISALANHLWQSTLFTAFAYLLTLALRKNRAQTRYWLWFAASIKFLVPCSILMAAGSHFGRPTEGAIPASHLSHIVDRVTEPFAATVPIAILPATQASSASLIPAILCAAWAIGFATLVCSWWRRWRRVRAALGMATPLRPSIELAIDMEVMCSPAFLEPGVFGVFRPVLLLPEGIAQHLTPPQLEAILTHELCHVRRHDNLAAVVHLAVEAVFWFHPLVWWLGARLVEERERACDEEVLSLGGEPVVYAEGILKICELYLDMHGGSLPCVAGVTGGNLKKRIEAIMANRVALRLSFVKKLALALAGAAAVAVPVTVGIMNAPQVLLAGTKPASATQQTAPVKLPTPELLGWSDWQQSIVLQTSFRSGITSWIGDPRFESRWRPEGKLHSDVCTIEIRPAGDADRSYTIPEMDVLYYSAGHSPVAPDIPNRRKVGQPVFYVAHDVPIGRKAAHASFDLTDCARVAAAGAGHFAPDVAIPAF